MELRRALLLFAIVLGVAAIATSLSRPAGREQASDPSPARPATGGAGKRPAPGRKAAIPFSASGKPRTERLKANRATAVTVEVPRPGQVELAGLGLVAAAEPLTPAHFEVLEGRAGSYDVRFTPAASGEARSVGSLRIVP